MNAMSGCFQRWWLRLPKALAQSSLFGCFGFHFQVMAFCTLYLVAEPSTLSSFSASLPLPGLWGWWPGLVQGRVGPRLRPSVSLQPCLTYRDWAASLSRAEYARLNTVFPCPLQAALYFQAAGRSVCWAFPLGFPHPWLMVLAGLNPVCSSNTGNLCWLAGDHGWLEVTWPTLSR